METLSSTAILMMILTSAARADLREYVARPDPSYAWSRLADGRMGNDAVWTELVMTSQTWHDIAWKHKLYVVRPARMDSAAQALLLISGGAWKPGDEGRISARDSREIHLAAAVAKATRRPVAVLRQVPHQPILGNMYEDEAISFTFLQYLITGESDWPLLLPMTKAAVRAMDTMQTFAKQEWNQEVRDFVVCGASKRGWTTYLSAVADKRVKAIAPMVFDTLRLKEQMQHQVETWGKYSDEIGDYTQLGLQKLIDTSGGQRLVALVDPYAYRKEIVQPKLIILATNDHYWPLDAANLYWPGLEGRKYLLYMPNAGHGIADLERVSAGLIALSLQTAGELEMPDMRWNLDETEAGLKLSIRADVKPVSVSAWTSRSASRDFRKAGWTSRPLRAESDMYDFTLPRPEEGYSAAFGEAVFRIDGRPLFLSTHVKIIGPAQASPTAPER